MAKTTRKGLKTRGYGNWPLRAEKAAQDLRREKGSRKGRGPQTPHNSPRERPLCATFPPFSLFLRVLRGKASPP